MSYQTIRLDIDGDIAILTLNDPASRNGLTETMQREMLDALAALGGRKDVGALIVTGAGQSFCSGANLGKLDKKADAADTRLTVGQAVAKSMHEVANPLILAIQRLPMPVVSAVNGAAAGAGGSIALSADVVVAGRSAFFLQTFLPRLGIVPDMGATWFVPHSVGRARATGLALLGDRLPAEKAEQWGLIWACVDDAALLDEARKIAARLAKIPPHAALEARRAFDQSALQTLEAQLAYEADRQRELLDLPSFAEGVQAFFEKREPVFRK